MAYTNYTDLVTSLEGYLSEDGLSAEIENFVLLFESVEGAKLNHPFGQVITTIDVSTSPADLPNDCEHVRTFGLPGQRPMDQVSLEKLYDRDRQRVYAVTAKSDANTTTQVLYLPTEPEASTTYQIVYRQKLATITDGSTLNWLYRNFPMLYVYGALLQAAPYMDQDPRIGTWNALYQGSLNALEASKNLIEQGAPIRSATRVRRRI